MRRGDERFHSVPQELQREEMYCRNRTLIGGKVTMPIIRNISLSLTQIYRCVSQVSRDCFALQWFEDRLGCHGGRRVRELSASMLKPSIQDIMVSKMPSKIVWKVLSHNKSQNAKTFVCQNVPQIYNLLPRFP